MNNGSKLKDIIDLIGQRINSFVPGDPEDLNAKFVNLLVFLYMALPKCVILLFNASLA